MLGETSTCLYHQPKAEDMMTSQIVREARRLNPAEKMSSEDRLLLARKESIGAFLLSLSLQPWFDSVRQAPEQFAIHGYPLEDLASVFPDWNTGALPHAIPNVRTM